MKLHELLVGLEVLGASADMDMEITSVAYDSRKVTPGCLFVAVTGMAVDGHKFISAAVQAGAAAVVWGFDPELSASDVRHILIDSGTIQVASLPDSPLAQGYYNLLDLRSAAEMVLQLSSGDDLAD